MVAYTLNIKVAPTWQTYFNDCDSQFCFARRSQSVGSHTTKDVIAHADEVATNINVEWKDEYFMAASKTGFSAMSKIMISTDPLPITFGQSFTLPEDWAKPTVNDDKLAPNNGFLFRNMPSAAAVLYQRVLGEPRPVYITPEGKLPPGATESMIPLVSVAVWFQRDVTSGTMIDTASVKPFIIHMTTTTMNVEYTEAGKCVLTSDTIDYTHGRYAKRMLNKAKASKGMENGVAHGAAAEEGVVEKVLE